MKIFKKIATSLVFSTVTATIIAPYSASSSIKSYAFDEKTNKILAETLEKNLNFVIERAKINNESFEKENLTYLARKYLNPQFDSKPRVLNTKEFENFCKENNAPILYRGIGANGSESVPASHRLSSKQLFEAFKEGNFPDGLSKGGIFFTEYGFFEELLKENLKNSRIFASQLAEFYATSQEETGNVFRCALDPNTKIINEQDIDGVKNVYYMKENHKDLDVKDFHAKYRLIAELLSFQAISQPWATSQRIVLDRSACIVDKDFFREVKKNKKINMCCTFKDGKLFDHNEHLVGDILDHIS